MCDRDMKQENAVGKIVLVCLSHKTSICKKTQFPWSKVKQGMPVY